MSVNPKLPKEVRIIAYLDSISSALHQISRDISHEIGPFKVGKFVEPKVINIGDSPEVQELKKQNRLLFITLIVSVSTTLIVGLADIVLRLNGK